MVEDTPVETPEVEAQPEITQPKLKLPKIDLRLIGAGALVAVIAVVNTVVVLRFAAPTLIIKDPRMQEVSEEHSEEPAHSEAPAHGAKLPRHVLSPSMENRYNLILDFPEVDPSSYLHPQAYVAGAVSIGPDCYIGPQASIRGDIAQNIHIGAESNLQDGAVITGLATEDRGEPRTEALVRVGDKTYSVYLEDRVTLAPQAQVHGPAYVGEGAYLGMQSLVFRAQVGKGCILEPRASVIGVSVPEGRYVAAGMLVNTQGKADALPSTQNHPYYDYGAQSVEVYKALTKVLKR